MRREHDDLAHCHFSHRAAVAVRVVEDGDAVAGAFGAVNLIDADAEGANGEERVGGLEHVRGNPGLRANA